MAGDPSRLYSALLNTGLQQKDNPLYQVIRDLIGILIDTNNKINSNSNNSIINMTQQFILFNDDSESEETIILKP